MSLLLLLFVTCISWTDAYYVPLNKEKKKIVNVPIVLEQSSNSVTVDLDINNGSENADDVNDGG
jgi:hypothetical protein